jgi:DNA-binding NarL/FixJ family response regulator
MLGDVISKPAIDDVLSQAARRFCHTAGLSGREQEILELAAQGFADKEISAQLCLAYTTVKTYWSRIFFKIAVKNRQLAIAKLLADLATRANYGDRIVLDSNTLVIAFKASEDDGTAMS